MKMRSLLLLLLVAIMLLAGSSIASGQGEGLAAINIVASEDAFTDINDSANPHNTANLDVEYTCLTSMVSKISWLKFNLSGLPTASDYYLKLYLKTPYVGNPATIGVYAVSDDTWTEGAITWNNQPTPGSLLATQTMPASPGWVSWQNEALDSFIDGERTGGGDNTASLALQFTGCPTGELFSALVVFDSTEGTVGNEPLGVTLSSFEAEVSGRSVVLEWSTASELNNEGFNVYRSEAEDGEYVKINEALIPAQGNPSTGASYSFTDLNVKRGRTYYYKLEDVDSSGVSTFHGPVSVTVPGKGR